MAYKMSMKFSISLSIKAINVVSEGIGIPKPILSDVVEATIIQTLPLVPTQEVIDQYAKAIKEGYSSDMYVAEKVTFTGYEYLIPVDDKEISEAYISKENIEGGK